MMAVEIVESNLVIVDNGIDANENEKVNIKFGSHGVDEPAKGEVNSVTESNLPKNAVDDWPEPQQIHSFYIVKYRALEDHSLKAKLDLAEKELQKKNQARFQIVEKIRAERADRGQVLAEIRSLSVENRQFRTIMDEKRKEMEPLQQALGKLRGTSGGGREKGSVICSSEAELNNLIKSLEYRIQHESIPLSEEKQILREIKQLEGTREKVIVYAAERAKIQDSMGEKDAIQGQVKSIGVDLDGVRKDKQVVNAKLKQLDEEKAAIEKDINALEVELTAITEKRDNIFETIRSMRKQREDGNSPFYQNRMVLTKAKALAANKEVDALKEHSDTEVENFMSLWNSNKSLRDDYESRILSSLDMRQLSKDGRLRNPNEKPILQSETPPAATPRTEVVAKQTPKEEPVVPTTELVDPPSDQKVEKTKGFKNLKEGNKKSEKTDHVEEEEFFSTKKDSLPKTTEVDEAKLKELKREEEIAKRIQAEDRKKKMAEKAAAKAAIKAEKEAEKKLKEREKRAKKKTGGGAITAVDAEEAVAEVAEPEKIEEEIETPVVEKVKDRKGSTVRTRVRPRGQDSLPKTILKRKKATNYLVWAAPAAVVVLLLVVVGYSYLS